jgi:hypothetical protein
MFIPVEVAHDLKELPEELHLSLDALSLLGIVVEDINDESVESIGGHARELGPQQRRLVGHPRLKQHDRPLHQVVSAHHLSVEVVHEVECAQTTVLPDGNVDAHAHKAKLDDFHVRLIHKNNVFELGVLQLANQLSDYVSLFDLRFGLSLVQVVILHRINLGLEPVEKLTQHFELGNRGLILDYTRKLASEVVVYYNGHIYVRLRQVGRERIRTVL